jgi:CBS domain-containing protein
MSKPVVTVDSGTPMQDVFRVLRDTNIHRLVVVDEKSKDAIGVVTDRAIFEAQFPQ